METLRNVILEYEKEFFTKSFCENDQAVFERLDKDFLEFGQSGKIYHRHEILEYLRNAGDRSIEILDFHVEKLCKSCCIAKYRCENDGKIANRTSIWIHIDNQWKLKFHQGSPVTL
jgi:ribonuclease HI